MATIEVRKVAVARRGVVLMAVYDASSFGIIHAVCEELRAPRTGLCAPPGPSGCCWSAALGRCSPQAPRGLDCPAERDFSVQ
ncbi:hypothetical protein NDU88_007152 [Pleurodeles waltl]|uniref:Uncharacterized protein n=1 Tax=Pleurodeles waltl TaxID=8319 RepID=A0AAV7N3H7_PLEWA|nr:hypothetical protein NDU88_007152 [Pleurodeles waltl]